MDLHNGIFHLVDVLTQNHMALIASTSTVTSSIHLRIVASLWFAVVHGVR